MCPSLLRIPRLLGVCSASRLLLLPTLLLSALHRRISQVFDLGLGFGPSQAILRLFMA